MSGFDEILNRLSIPKRLNELPDTIIAKVTEMYIGNDRRGKEALFVVVKMDDGSTLKFKFGKLLVRDFIDALVKLGFKNGKDIMNKRFKWQKISIRTTFGTSERYIPVEVLE